MPRITRLLLDVLKPNHPNILEFAQIISEGSASRARLSVVDRDDKTQTLQIEVTGTDIDFDRLRERIEAFGASLHSIDEVEIDAGSTA